MGGDHAKVFGLSIGRQSVNVFKAGVRHAQILF